MRILLCEICHRRRDQADITAYTTGFSIHGVPVNRNVAHCNDDRECIEKGRALSLSDAARMARP